MTSERTRCAIYTRKSTEEGLDQDFNSLDAQRESCEAYIASQRSLGWVLAPSRFDDGGISGGTMQRPALQAMLADIEQGRIDTVVVYKVDRLTRSLTDFQKMVEIFDAHRVSFVSVTQQFNTTTSMGRLTLNMLLSFAQFEREVTGERIRDKIAASKQKGMWMGGPVPVGYDVRDRKLVVNEAEAETVRTLFTLYLQQGTVEKVAREAARLNLKTKRRRSLTGNETGGGRFYRGHLHQLLMNPIYIGEIAHRGSRYPGQHQAIVDREIFQAVQDRIADQRPAWQSKRNASHPSLLAGLIFDETGDRLTPVATNKGGRRYRYYVSSRLVHRSDGADDGWRIPVHQLDRLVKEALASLLREPLRLVAVLGIGRSSPDLLQAAIRRGTTLADAILSQIEGDTQSPLRTLISRIDLASEATRIELDAAALEANLGISIDDGVKPGFSIPMQLKRRGVETRLVLGGQAAVSEPDHRLIELVTRAHRWAQQLIAGEVASVTEIAAAEGLDRSDVGRSLQLAFLAPGIVEAILSGRQPVEMTHRSLSRIGDLPVSWADQRIALGFTD